MGPLECRTSPAAVEIGDAQWLYAEERSADERRFSQI